MSPNPPKHIVLKQALSRPDAVIAESCRRSFFFFMQTFWDQISADVPSWNWHIPYLCAQLMNMAHKVARGEPREHDMIINIPPGTTKSVTCSVMFPVWCWINWHWMRFITASYSAALSLELAEYSRDLIRSRRFQELFPEIIIKADKDTKSNFRIEKRIYDDLNREVGRELGGNRYSTSVGGTLTGFHGHILIVDDPLNPTQAVSEVELRSANHWLDNTLSTRKINKLVTPTLVIMQRLHKNDPTGHLLEKKKDRIFHICLPGEIKNYKDLVNPPELLQYYSNDLLDPVRMPWSVMNDLEADLGQYGKKAQIGQSPSIPGSGMFDTSKIKLVNPEGFNYMVSINRVLRSWDNAASEGAGAFTAGMKIAELRTSGGPSKYLIMDLVHGQWGSEKRELIKEEVTKEDGPHVIVLQEQEGGSGGKDQALATQRALTSLGNRVVLEHPTGSKVYRADPVSVAVNRGQFYMFKADWNETLLNELADFPMGKYKDIVDCLSGGYNYLTKNKTVQVH